MCCVQYLIIEIGCAQNRKVVNAKSVFNEGVQDCHCDWRESSGLDNHSARVELYVIIKV